MKKAARKSGPQKYDLGREGGIGLGMVANTIINCALIDDKHGQTSVVGKVTAVSVGTHSSGSVGIGSDASVRSVRADFGNAAGNGLTQLVTLYSNQRLLIFDFHNNLPAFRER